MLNDEQTRILAEYQGEHIPDPITPIKIVDAPPVTNIVQAIKEALSQSPDLRKELERAIFSPAELDIIHNKDKFLPASPYYKEHYALSLKPVIDRMMVDGENRIIRYKSFPKHSHRTVQLMIYQAYKYLQLEMDAEGVYARFRDNMEIQNKSDGVHLVLVKNIVKYDLAFSDAAEILLPPKERSSWKGALQDFISTPWTPELTKDECSLIIDKLSLSEDEVEQAELILSGTVGIFGKVSVNAIKVIKTNPQAQMEQT